MKKETTKDVPSTETPGFSGFVIKPVKENKFSYFPIGGVCFNIEEKTLLNKDISSDTSLENLETITEQLLEYISKYKEKCKECDTLKKELEKYKEKFGDLNDDSLPTNNDDEDDDDFFNEEFGSEIVYPERKSWDIKISLKDKKINYIKSEPFIVEDSCDFEDLEENI